MQPAHDLRVGMAAKVILPLVFLVGGIWYLDANVSKDVAFAVIAATFAVVSAVFGYEVLRIGTQGSLNAAWKVVAAIAFGSIPVVLVAIDYVLAYVDRIAVQSLSQPETMVFIALVLGAIGSPLLAVAYVAARWLLPMGRAASVILSVLFALYGALALGTVLESTRLFGFGWFIVIVGLIVIAFVSDASADCVGRTYGGHRIAPRISLHKTWKGLIGGMLAAGALVLIPSMPLVLIASYGGLGSSSEGTSPPPPFLLICLLSSGVIFTLGSLIAVFGTVGSLFASWFQRQAEIDDPGGLTPVHSGFLDRIGHLILVFSILPILALGLFGISALTISSVYALE